MKKIRKNHLMSASGRIPVFGICEVDGKIRYGSRKDAKLQARRLYPGDHLTAYDCGDYWHFGHPPQRVIHGGEWGGEHHLERVASAIKRDLELESPACEACGADLVDGVEHECEVVGIDDLVDLRKDEK